MRGRQAKKPSWAQSHHSKPKRKGGRRERAVSRQAKRARYA